MIDLFSKYDTFKSKDSANRLRVYASYLDERRLNWYQPDLDAYRTYLTEERKYAARSIKAHLTSIRNWYRDLLERIEDEEGVSMAEFLMREGLHLDEDQARSARATMRAAAKYDPATDAPAIIRDWYAPREYLQNLFDFPLNTPQDLRDLLVLGLIFCAGLTQSEVASLEVKHLRGARTLKLLVPTRSGEEQEITVADDVLFDRAWLGKVMSLWLQTMNIKDGLIGRGFFKAGIRPRDTHLTVRGVEKLVKQHAIRAAGSEADRPLITPMDLRRCAARRLYLSNVDVETIKDLLGLSTVTATMIYIGPPELHMSIDPLNGWDIWDQLDSFPYPYYL